MTKEQELYLQIGKSLKNAEESQMFGKPCFKIKSKAFMCFFENSMVFKLPGDTHKDAISLKGAKLFDPSGKGRAMKEWVQVTADHKDKWKVLATAAYEYVKSSS
jgi:hypothetical protein